MARRFIIDSLKYWVNEYHVDGFRFDLMGVYDIYTVKKIRSELDKIDPSIIMYGEGWSGGTTQLVPENSALKANGPKFGKSQVAMFSDDLRDGLKGHVFTENAPGYINGKEDLEDTIKFGIVASTQHDGIDYSKVNYSKEAWANEPYQTINYVTSHDNHMLWDRLQLSAPDASESDRLAMNRLAATIVWTSQGIPFMQAGEEFARTKRDENGNLEGNSYKSPDSVNELDWNRIGEYKEAFFVGVLSAIALEIVGIDYAFIIGVIAGICNMIPYVGPIVGTILAAIMGLLSGNPLKILYAIISMLVVQQIDNNLLAPKIVGDSVGLHPVFTMMAILIGGNIGGLFGMLLSVPIAASFRVLFNNWYDSYIKTHEKLKS